MSRIGKQNKRNGLLSHCSKYAVFMAAFGVFFILGGGGVDFARACFAENALERALANTADDLTRTMRPASLYRLQAEAEKRLAGDISIFDFGDCIISVSVSGPSVRIYASAEIPTVFLSIWQRHRLPVEAAVTGQPPRPSRNLAWWV